MAEKLIFHVDVNSAYLSWEAVYRLKFQGEKADLREIPSAVAGDAAMRHGIILAKSIPAKKYGIQTGESIPEAKRKCPELFLVPPDYGLYERCSNAFLAILKEYTPQVEQYSIDEAYMDMTKQQLIFKDPVKTAEEIKGRVKEELGFTINIGISTNKLLAKMASDFKKPDLAHTLYPEEIKEKMWSLPVSDLFFVGRATAKKLLSLGIHTIGELARTDPQVLKSHLKKQGEIIWGFANGIDFSVVQPEAIPNKGYGNSATISFDVRDKKTAKLVLLALSETLGERLRSDRVKAGLICVELKNQDFFSWSHQRVLENATDITKEIHQNACRLFDEMWDQTPLRKLGIHTGKISKGDQGRQICLFEEEDYEKLERADAMADEIRRRYGRDLLIRSSFLAVPCIRPMEGGVSGGREREI